MLACFNTKTGEGWKIYDDAKALSVVYLFSVGGFQISMLKLFIGKIIRNKKISAITNVLIIGIYSWTLNFSPGIMRVLFYLILSGIFTKKLTNRYDILAISGILTIFFNPNCVFNYGWILSYICTYIVLYIYWKNICNKFLEAILINISCIVISLPFIMKMDNTINLNSIFLGIFVSCITIFAFCWFFLTFWIIWFKLIHELVANITYGCLKGLCFYPSVNVPIKSLGETFYVFYYLISYSAILFWDVYNYNYDKNNKRFQNESNI
jgi:ComEC/Rec2-related protein